MTFSGGSHFPSPPCLMFGFSNIQLPLLLPLSCPQLCQSVLHTICPCKTLLLWSLSTILTTVSITGTLNPFISYSHSTHQIHTVFPSGCLELLLPLASLFFCCIDQLHQSARQQPNFILPSLSFAAQNIGKFYVCFCFDLLNRCKTRQAQHLFS